MQGQGFVCWMVMVRCGDIVWARTAAAAGKEEAHFEPMDQTCNMGHHNILKKSEHPNKKHL